MGHSQKAQGQHCSPESYRPFVSHVNTYKSNFPYCCPILSLGAMTLYEANSSGSADLEEIFFIILILKTHLKMVFPNVAPTDFNKFDFTLCQEAFK
jgi:hypothetical protein